MPISALGRKTSRSNKGRFDVPTEDELVGVAAHAGADADLFLCCTQTREAQSEHGDDANGFPVHVRCVGDIALGKRASITPRAYEAAAPIAH